MAAARPYVLLCSPSCMYTVDSTIFLAALLALSSQPSLDGMLLPFLPSSTSLFKLEALSLTVSLSINLHFKHTLNPRILCNFDSESSNDQLVHSLSRHSLRTEIYIYISPKGDKVLRLQFLKITTQLPPSFHSGLAQNSNSPTHSLVPFPALVFFIT